MHCCEKWAAIWRRRQKAQAAARENGRNGEKQAAESKTGAELKKSGKHLIQAERGH